MEIYQVELTRFATSSILNNNHVIIERFAFK